MFNIVLPVLIKFRYLRTTTRWNNCLFISILGSLAQSPNEPPEAALGVRGDRADYDHAGPRADHDHAGPRADYDHAGTRADHDHAGLEYRYLDWYATANTDYV
jgi:hypothetical protein